MKQKKIAVLIGVMALLLSACAAPGGGSSSGSAMEGSSQGSSQSTAEAGAYHKITAAEAKDRMDQGGVVVVDVRRADEYEAGHIPGAINLPNEDIGASKPEALPDQDAELIVYCRTGVRSKEASDKLVELGYTNVNDMGGIVDWTYDTVTGSEPGVYTPQELPGVLSSFAATDLEGNPVDQSVLSDHKLTMVNVWATFCGPCLREMPDLGELSKEYEEKGVQIIGLVSDVFNTDGTISDEQVSLAKEIVEETGADYLHILPSSDLTGLMSQIYAVPTTFFVDSEGRQVGDTYVQSMSKEKWAKAIESVLAEME